MVSEGVYRRLNGGAEVAQVERQRAEEATGAIFWSECRHSGDQRFPILSDPTKATARAYGVLAPSGFASRRTFYIGADGRIAAIDKEVRASSHGGDVVAQLKALGVPEQ
jgi:alkyl hydroperoxide reductase subunit AhpC